MAAPQENKLGKLVPDGEGAKDAVHVPIAPAVATEDLWPGQHVFLAINHNTFPDISYAATVAMQADKVMQRYPHGIIDPFLTEPVRNGQTCYVMLYPNSVTDLRHEWSHPSFADETNPDQPEYEDDGCSGCW